MKYYSTLPVTAISAVALIAILVSLQVIPSGMEVLEALRNLGGDAFYVIICAIILLESIVYIGFYFPGQFFAVVLVISAQPDAKDIVMLTVAMVVAATLGSLVNYTIGRYFSDQSSSDREASIKHLLLAMIHMNSLAFFMLAQGANKRSISVVAFAGVLNLPYYLLLISGTVMFGEQIMKVAENTYLVVALLLVWLAIAVCLDYRKRKANVNATLAD